MNIKKISAKILAAVMALSAVSGIVPNRHTEVYAANIQGWTVGKGATGDSDTDAVIDNEVKYRGSGSLKAWNHSKDAPGGVDRYGSVVTTVNGLKKGKTYKWGFMAKCLNSTNTITYLDWGPPRISLQPFTNTYDWTPFEFTYTHEGDSPQVTLRISFEDYVEAFWIDEVYFYEIQDGTKVGENLISNPGFDTETVTSSNSSDDNNGVLTYDKYLKTSRMIPVYKTDPLTIDGDLSDWDDKHDRIALDRVSTIEGGSVDMTVSMSLAWDDKYLYVGIDVEDDSHEPVSGSTFWMGDCVQVALSYDTPDRTYGTEIGFNLSESGVSEINQVSNSEMQFKAAKNGTNIKYEIAVPWSLSFGDAPESLLFNVLINDTDNGVRKYCLELDPKGISYNKSAQTNPRLILCEDLSDVPFLSSITGPENIVVNTPGTYTASVFNTSEEGKTFTFAIEGGEETSIVVPGNSAGSASLEYISEKLGNKTVNFTVSNGENVQKDSKTVNIMMSEILPTKEEAEAMLKKLEGYVKDIEPLLTECEFMGYELTYEKSDAYILERFAKLNRDKIEAGNYKFITYQYSKLTEIYNDLKVVLESYIAGEAKPKNVPRMVTSDERDIIDGQSFIRDVEYEGEITKRPYFYTGTGHWNYVWNDLENLKTIGYDFIHMEIGPNQVIYPESFASGWNVSVLGSVPDYSVELADDAHGGSYAGKIVNNTEYNYNNFITVIQSVKVEPNTVYDYGLFAKATNAPSSLKMYMGATAYQDRISMGGTYGWTEYSGTYMTGPEETTATFVITSDSPVTAFYFDDAYIKKQGTDENLLKNADFEQGADDLDTIGNGCKADYSQIDQLEEALAKAEETGVAVDLLITPHYFPTFLFTKDPTMNDSGKIIEPFMPMNPTHPTVKWVLEKYIDILMSRVKDYKSLHSVVLSNEPVWSCNMGTYYLPQFRDKLREKYSNDINELNAAYGGSEYTDFDQIGWPSTKSASAYYNDYKEFNDSILAEYHRYLAEAVKKAAPDIPVHTKVMMTMKGAKPQYDRIGSAMNYELWTDFLDINGNDGGASGFNGETASDIFVLESWYDFLTSAKDAPCVNSEDHILAATDTMNYSELLPAYTAAQVWQGAIHGRSGTNLWLWDVKEFGENNSLLTNRPMVVSKTAKAGFDLNRAAYEVTAIQKQKRRVAIMQSTYSQQSSDQTYNTYAMANKYVLMNGLRPFWLTDMNYSRIHEFELVILPDTLCVSDEAFAEIKKYAENGGKLLILGERSLTMDQNSKKRDESEVKKVKDLALDVVNVAYLGNYVQNLDTFEKAIEDAIASAGINNVIVRDAKTGEKVDNVEWLCGVYDGNLCVNMHNAFDEGDREVYIEVNGKRVQSFTELRSGEEYNDGVITLKVYEPVLVKFEIDNPFFDTYGHWAEDAIGSVWKKGIVEGRTESEFDPDALLTGGEIATLIAKSEGYIINSSDSDANWYDGAVNALKANGVDGSALESPSAPVSRENIAELCVKAMEKRTAGTVPVKELTYKDKADISQDKLSYVEKAVALGIMEGYDTNEFKPKGYVTRAEMVKIIENISEK